MVYGADSTFGDLIERVVDTINGGGLVADQVATLGAAITSSSTSIALATTDDYRTGAANLVRGLMEIDDELVWADSSDGLTATVRAWGRGYKGTTAAAHSAGAKVTLNPRIPRVLTGAAINRTMRSLFSRHVYAVGSTTLTGIQYPYTEELPAEAMIVLVVESRHNATGQWVVERAWEQTPDGIVLPSGVYGNQVRVTYSKQPTLFTSTGDTWQSTGLHDTMKDVVVSGAVADLAEQIDLSRLTTESAESQSLAQARPLGQATSIGSRHRQAFELGVQRERQRLLTLYPHRIHQVRG